MAERLAHVFSTGAIVSLLAALTAPASLSAQAIDTPQGRLEFIGLERWTPTMVLDSVEADTPGLPVSLYPVVLRRLGFPRASVERVVPDLGAAPPNPSDRLTLLTVVEPHRAGDLTLRGGFEPGIALPASWSEADNLFRQNNPEFLASVGMRLPQVRQDEIPEALRRTLRLPADRELAERVWVVLDGLTSSEDLDSALELLATDADPEHRALAAAVLGGFPEQEGAWRGLVEALLDPSARVTAVANQALGSMVVARPMMVDWTPSESALRGLIAGANLSGFGTLLQVLVSTEISPALAPALLAGNDHLILGHLASASSPHRTTTRRFLTRLAGSDLGPDPTDWRQWIGGL